MFITRLRLEGYKRLMLASIKVFEITPRNSLQIILGTNGSGKAQPLNAWIKVPGGWKTMGDMKVGTEVIAKDGSTTKVTGVFPQGKKQIYKITFADGRTARATGDHLWKIYHGGKDYPIVPKVITTDEIISELSGWRKHLLWVDLADSEQCADQTLPIDPYVLGVVLGDGRVLGGAVVITHPDEHIMRRVESKLGPGLEIGIRKHTPPKRLTYSIKPTRDAEDRGYNNLPLNRLTLALREYGLDNKGSHEKFIPPEYLRASTEQRLELLRGLMDMDGYIGKGSTCSFCSTSQTLASNVVYLVRSLGGIAKLYPRVPTYTDTRGNKRNGRVAYNVHIRFKKPSELFTLPRKKERANDNGQYNKTLKLRILSIEPDGVEDAQCISIDHPDKLYLTDQFVVTHNSSILEEMSPVPGNKSDYIKGGKKIFECNDNGHTYALTSHYVHGSGKHSFLKDGEELNKGGTLQIQKELAFQEFGLNKERLDVLLGITRFTAMSVAKRREWLTELSPVDLDYAFSVLRSVKGAKRDADGVVKHTAQRIHRESQDFPGESERQALKQRVVKLTDQLNLLFQHSRIQGEPTQQIPMSFVKALSSSCEGLRETLRTYPELPPTYNVKTAQEASGVVLGLSRDYLHLETQLKEKQAKFLALEKQQPQQRITYSAEDIAALKSRHSELTQQCQDLPEPHPTQHFPLIDLADFPDALSYLQGVLDEWEGLMVTIPDNTEGRFSRERLQGVSERHRALQGVITRAEDRCVTIRHRMQNLKACEAVECPNCQHSFRPGVDPNEVVSLKKEYGVLTAQIEEDKKALERDHEYLEACQGYLEYRKRFYQFTRMHPRLQDFFVVWIEKGLIQSPLSYQSEYAQWREQMVLLLKRSTLKKSIEAIVEQIKLAEDTQRYQNLHLKEQLTQLQGEIEDLTSRVREVQQEHRSLKRTLEHMTHTEARLKHHIGQLEALMQVPPRLLEESLVTLVQERIKEIQLQLAQAQERLSKSDIQEGILRDLEAQHHEILQSQNDYALLVKSMSPNEGLIGRYLMGFMQIVVKFMNAIIARVWTHSLEILPSKVDKDELDYRFPLNVQNGAVTPPDIALGSSAQRDIVDFAFRLLLMKFLKIEHLPLYLDELGNMFDEEHRVNLIRLIENMLEVGHTPQVFFISHYMSTHGALEKAADVCVVDDTNITVPQRYNEHVTIH